MSYSQNNEEAIITDFFNGKTGRFLDIGAYDGKAFSNTMRLAELGWGGVCVEPSPNPLIGLLKHHAERPNIDIVNVALGETAGFMDFHDSGGDAISTLDMAHRQKWEAGWKAKFTKFKIFTVTVPMLLDEVGPDFEFINLDVESLNIQLFRALPLEIMSKVRLICVEHDGHHAEMESIAGRCGYKQIAFNGENIILGR